MTGSTLLVVSDVPQELQRLLEVLSQDSYEVKTATSGFSALQVLQSQSFDVIIIDVLQSIIDGVEVCRRIKDNPSWSWIPVIVILPLNNELMINRVLTAGADEFVVQPVGHSELLARVRSMLRVKHHYDTLQHTLILREDLAEMIVHDLRNPLTVITLATQLLKETPLQDRQRLKLEQIITGIQKIRLLTDTILILGKGTAGKLQLSLSWMSMQALIKQEIKEFELIAQQKDIHINFVAPDHTITLKGDDGLLRRVLDNLLSNAIKFSPKSSNISIELLFNAKTDKRVIIIITDQGEGIPESIKQLIFEKYEIGQIMDNVPQIGLGLSFCKMVIEAHEGMILVEDNFPQGAKFIITLPLAMR